MTGLQVCLWLGVAAVVAAIGFAIFQVIKQEQRERQEADSFLDEANQVMGLRFETEARDQYIKKREEVFTAFKSKGNLTSADIKDGPEVAPDDCWLRKLSQKESAALKSALVKRALVLQPLVPQLQHEMQARYALLQRGLLNERQWAQMTSLKDLINVELTTVQREAESLQAGYGVKIFKEAKMFHDHQLAKRQHENLKQQLMVQFMAKGMPQEAAMKAAEEQLQRAAEHQTEQLQQLVAQAQAAKAAQIQ